MRAPPQLVFGVPLHSAKLSNFDVLQPRLVSEIASLRAESPGVQRSNQGAWHSNVDLATRATGALAEVRGALHAALSPLLAPPGLTLEWLEFWAISAGPGDWLAPHRHPAARWSGVLYVDAERHVEASAKHGKLEIANPDPLAELTGGASGVVVPPIDGVALAFPATLLHWVHPQRLPGPRVVLSFNLGLRR